MNKQTSAFIVLAIVFCLQVFSSAVPVRRNVESNLENVVLRAVEKANESAFGSHSNKVKRFSPAHAFLTRVIISRPCRRKPCPTKERSKPSYSSDM